MNFALLFSLIDMTQFNQWLHSTIKEKENELQALYLLEDKGKHQQGQAGSAAALALGPNRNQKNRNRKSLRSLLGIR